jgi:hypothetical protein
MGLQERLGTVGRLRQPRANSREFIDSDLVPAGEVRVAAFDGENADPANGRRMGDDILYPVGRDRLHARRPNCLRPGRRTKNIPGQHEATGQWVEFFRDDLLYVTMSIW